MLVFKAPPQRTWVAARAGERRPSALAAVDLVLAMANGEPKGFGPRDEVLRKVLRPVASPLQPVALGTGT